MERDTGKNERRMGVLLSYLNLLIGCVIPLFYTPVMLKLLGQKEYGLYSLAVSLTGYLSLLNFGVGSAVNRYLIGYRIRGDKRGLEQMLGMFFLLYVLFAVGVCAGGTGMLAFTGTVFGKSLSLPERHRLKLLLLFLTIRTAVSFLTSVFSSVLVVCEKYIVRKLADGAGTLLVPAINLLLLYRGYASLGIAAAEVMVQLLYLAGFYLFCRKRLGIRMRFRQMPFSRLGEIGRFSGVIFLSALMDLLYWSTDKVMIAVRLGTAAVAVYNIGGTWSGMLQNVSSAISSVSGTKVTAMVLSGAPIEALTEIFIRVGRIQYLAVSFFLSGYLVFGKRFLHFWAGDAYGQAYYVGLLTMVPLAVPLIQNVAYTMIVAQNRHQFRAVCYGFIAVLNVAGTWMCLPRYGILGAAFCTAAAFLVGNGLIMNVYYARVTKLDIRLFWKNILHMTRVPAGLTAAAWLWRNDLKRVEQPVGFLVSVLIFACLFWLGSWKYSMNTCEKAFVCNMVRGTLERIPKRKRIRETIE